jgi:hypothetical protein
MLTFEHPGAVYALAFSHGGQMFATIGPAGEGGRHVTRLWRGDSFDATLPFPGGVAVAPDGTVYAVGGAVFPNGFVARLDKR